MSDQADRLQATRGSETGGGAFADSTEVERGTTAVDSKSASLADDSIPTLHKR